VKSYHLFCFFLFFLSLHTPALSTPLKPRMIVLTDISPANHEPDDMESMIRLLVHADLFEIEGLVVTTGWSYSEITSDNLSLVHKVIDAYEKDLPNLLKRSGQTDFLSDESTQRIGYWPSPDYLRSRVMMGSKSRGQGQIGEDNDSAGSKLIIQSADESDDRPVWIQAWGGGNTLAQAIWRIKRERSEERLKAFLHKIRVYTITDQDRSYKGGTPFNISSHQWMRREFEKDLLFIWDECAWKFQNGTGRSNWEVYASQIQRHGHLGDIYPKYRYGVEGDTPAFLYIMPNGLNNPEVPGQGSWGGYFVWAKGPDNETYAYINHQGPAYTICQELEKHFYPATFNSFAARMDWAKNGVGNRNPVVIINGDESIDMIMKKPRPGAEVTLDASQTYDSDGDKLSFNWWILSGAGTYTREIVIANSETSRATVEVPADSAGKTFHVICEVTDDGSPNLTGYRRIIFEPVRTNDRPRVIATTDGEIDDECSMVRFLLYANEWDVEAIVTSSSQYHCQGRNWAGDDWIAPYLDAYAQVYPNLVKHDPRYPTPETLRTRTFLGNVKAEGEMEEITAGSQAIVKVLLDDSDPRAIWLQAWGGVNTIARALKTIEEEHPDRMRDVAHRIRFFFIWEQDSTYQDYIHPHWGKYNIPTVVSDQFLAIAYHWKEIIPQEKHKFFSAAWMKDHILEDHGPLCALYKAHRTGDQGFDEGDFRSEGDSPSFLHIIPNGLRSAESPAWGGWGGRYARVRANIWLDPVPEPGYHYPEGRWYTSTAWGRQRLRENIQNDKELMIYLKPVWRWSEAIQNDWAARADWCVKPYNQANHPPVVKLAHALDLKGRPGEKVSLSAKGTTDPDGDALTYRWWQYQEADTYEGIIDIANAGKQDASFTVPGDGGKGETIHVICEVTDDGTPPLARYQRAVVEIE